MAPASRPGTAHRRKIPEADAGQSPASDPCQCRRPLSLSFRSIDPSICSRAQCHFLGNVSSWNISIKFEYFFWQLCNATGSSLFFNKKVQILLTSRLEWSNDANYVTTKKKVTKNSLRNSAWQPFIWPNEGKAVKLEMCDVGATTAGGYCSMSVVGSHVHLHTS